jgi:hypothetical protein
MEEMSTPDIIRMIEYITELRVKAAKRENWPEVCRYDDERWPLREELTRRKVEWPR